VTVKAAFVPPLPFPLTAIRYFFLKNLPPKIDHAESGGSGQIAAIPDGAGFVFRGGEEMNLEISAPPQLSPGFQGHADPHPANPPTAKNRTGP
jgi:hypothetical protein